MKLFQTFSIILVLAAFASPVVRAADDDKPTIAPEDAREHVGKEVTVEMTVEGGKKISANGPCLLNSMKKFSDPKCLTLAILASGLAKYKEIGVEDPSVTLKGKKVRVTGKVELYKDQPQIKITSPDQIKEVEPPKVGF